MSQHGFGNNVNLVKTEDQEDIVEISDVEIDMVQEDGQRDEYQAENAANGRPIANVGKNVEQDQTESRSASASCHGADEQQRVEMNSIPNAGSSTGENAEIIAREPIELRSAEGLNLSIGSNRSKDIKCEVCRKKFSSTALLIVHRKVHFDSHPIHCGVCFHTFSSQLAKMTHENQCNQKRFECYVCGNNIVSYSALKTHMFVHSGIKPYACSKCKVKRFSRIGDYNRHVLNNCK